MVKLNDEVVKVGKTTELTLGKITALNVTMKVFIGDKEFLFIDQIVTSNMSDKGDSGALLMNNKNEAVGLVFSSSHSISICNRIDNVLRSLDVKIVVS